MPGVLLVERSDAHAVLTLNRPDKRNALSVQLRDAISSALDALASDEGMKCVVLTGCGTVFSSGFDLSEFTRAADDETFGRELWASSDRFHDTVPRFPLPTIAAVNGPALAGGFDLAVMCDVRVASNTARFAHPELAFGDVVYGPLHDLVGASVARDLCLTGRILEAAEALTLGFVSSVVAGDDLAAHGAQTAGAIARAPRDVRLRGQAEFIRRANVVTGTTLDL